MTEKCISGLHHLTAICGPPQRNLDFHVGTLGQRLVKRTVNFDDPNTYHLYYGDPNGAPGTIMTVFPIVNATPGRAGPGMASAYAYAVPKGGFEHWMERLAEAASGFEGPFERFGNRVIVTRDPDGAPVELVETGVESEGGRADALDGFHSVTLWQADPDPTARLLTEVMGYDPAGQETVEGVERMRFEARGGAPGAVVDLIRTGAAPAGRQGRGAIHHVAFRARDDADQQDWRARLLSAGIGVSPVMDRQYFNSIYFREPGGVLFEIATDPPGFAVDEPAEALGRDLKLPPRYEQARAQIERRLPALEVPS